MRFVFSSYCENAKNTLVSNTNCYGWCFTFVGLSRVFIIFISQTKSFLFPSIDVYTIYVEGALIIVVQSELSYYRVLETAVPAIVDYVISNNIHRRVT